MINISLSHRLWLTTSGQQPDIFAKKRGHKWALKNILAVSWVPYLLLQSFKNIRNWKLNVHRVTFLAALLTSRCYRQQERTYNMGKKWAAICDMIVWSSMPIVFMNNDCEIWRYIVKWVYWDPNHVQFSCIFFLGNIV